MKSPMPASPGSASGTWYSTNLNNLIPRIFPCAVGATFVSPAFQRGESVSTWGTHFPENPTSPVGTLETCRSRIESGATHPAHGGVCGLRRILDFRLNIAHDVISFYW